MLFFERLNLQSEEPSSGGDISEKSAYNEKDKNIPDEVTLAKTLH